MAEVFVSYSRKDQLFVRRLHEALGQRGREAWVDWDDIRPTEEFMRAIFAAIEGADTFVFVLSPVSVTSSICAMELAHAAKHNKRMVPLVARDVEASAVPESLAKLNWIFSRENDDFEGAVDTLLAALDTDLDWVRTHTRLLGRAIEWDARGGNDSFVLRGVDLQEGESWLSQAGSEKERQPTALQTDYILSSRKAATRRQRILLGSVTFGFVVAIVLAVLAFFARQEAVRQETQARLTSVQADFDLAVIHRDRPDTIDPRTLAYLARALRTMPEARLPRMYLRSLLSTTSWWLPQTEPLRHEGDVVAAHFSPDGQYIVTGSTDQTALVWNAETGAAVTEPLAHTVQLSAVGFSPDGRRVVTASGFGGTAQVWNVATGKPSRAPFLPPGEAVVAAEFSPDGSRILTASFHAQVWNVVTGVPVGEALRHGDALTTASFSADGTHIVTASLDWKARVWDAETGKPVIEPVAHQGTVKCATFAPDGQWFVTGSEDNTARVWNAVTGVAVTEPFTHQGSVVAASFSADRRRIVTASRDGYARVWDVSTSKLHGSPMRHAGEVADARFSPDSRWVVTASLDGTARVWDAETGVPLGQPMRHERAVLKASFSRDGRRIVTASQDHTARVWNRMTPGSVPKAMDHEARITSAVFSADRSRIVSTVDNSTVQLWSPDTGKEVGETLRNVFWVSPAEFSRDGRWVLAVLDDGGVEIRDASTGKQSGERLRQTDKLRTASFSPDGQQIVTSSLKNIVQVWGFRDRSLLFEFPHNGDIESVQFSRDGRLLIVLGRAHTIRVWNAQEKKPLAEALPLPNQGFHAAAFSADGAWIVAPLTDFTARVRNFRSGKVVGNPMQHDGQIDTLSFSDDGRRVVTGGYDNTAQVWDTGTATPVGSRIRHAGPVRVARFNADGSLLITAGDDGIARVWDTETGKPGGEPLRHDAAVQDGSFSRDGARILTASGNRARVWDVAVDTQSTLPAWVPLLAEALAGRRLNQNGVLIAPEMSVVQLRRTVMALKGTDFWSRLGRWFFATGKRNESPDSQ